MAKQYLFETHGDLSYIHFKEHPSGTWVKANDHHKEVIQLKVKYNNMKFNLDSEVKIWIEAHSELIAKLDEERRKVKELKEKSRKLKEITNHVIEVLEEQGLFTPEEESLLEHAETIKEKYFSK